MKRRLCITCNFVHTAQIAQLSESTIESFRLFPNGTPEVFLIFIATRQTNADNHTARNYD